MTNIRVIIPHYRATRWLIPCLDLLRCRASAPFACEVWTMEDAPDEAQNVAELVGHRARVIHHPTPGRVGGQPLPEVLKSAMWSDFTGAPITVTVDPDALILANGWDDCLRAIFDDPAIVCAGINPRSDTPDFAGVPEWNWMAFRTEFWWAHVKTFQYNRIDIGHLFSDAALRTGQKCHTWPLLRRPIAHRAASIAGDALGEWCLHAFYSTRRRDDRAADADREWMLSDSEELGLIQWAGEQ